MKQLLCLFALLLTLSGSIAAQTATDKFSSDLLARVNDDPEAMQEVLVFLSDQVNTTEMLLEYEARRTPLKVRHYEVVTALKAKAAATQPAFLGRIYGTKGIESGSVNPLWIANAVFLKANKQALFDIASWPETGELIWNAPTTTDLTAPAAPAPPGPNGSEIGLRAIKAHKLWQMGYTGYGKKALIADSGEDPEHPALMEKFYWHYAPISEAWRGSAYPEACGDHGTHVTGTVLGLNRRTNDTIGVAYNALWMGGPLEFSNSCPEGFAQDVYSPVQVFQWALDPDEDANTNDDVPDVINCSFSSGTFGCGLGTTNILISMEAAGIPVVWSAGNDGPSPSTVCCAQNVNVALVNTFSVGAVDGANPNFPIADFSSRGPSDCSGSGSLAIKPEVSGPGVSVRSATEGGGYGFLDGTSMATPHVSGAVLLLREAFPDASGTEIKLALYNSAIDLGTPGEDNSYGMGMIDLEAAFNYLVGEGYVPATPPSADRDVIILNATVDGICKGSVGSSVTFENGGTEPITSLQISFGPENGVSGTYTWTGNLQPNTFTTISLPELDGITPGTYDFVVELSEPNGQTDERVLNNRFKRRFTMEDEDYAVADVTALQTQPVCNNAAVLLEYTGDLNSHEIVKWYSAETNGTLLHIGESYQTPPLSNNTTYWVTTSQILKTGKAGIDANGNTGSSIQGSLIFDADQTFLLKSVKIYADETGTRLIRVLDASGSTVASKAVAINQTGEQRIELNLTIPAGDNMELTLFGGKNLKTTSTNPGYPYNLPGYMTIRRGKTPSGVLTSLVYYYFFDWEIELPLVCGRSPVDVAVSGSPSADPVSFTVSEDTVYLSTGATVTFTDQTPGVTERYWYFDDGSTGTNATETVTFADAREYEVSLVVVTASGCANSTSKKILVLAQPVSNVFQAPDYSGRMFLFPNPANESLQLGFIENAPKDMQVSVSDLTGKEVLRYNGNTYNGDTVPLDISGLPSGMYMVQVRSAGALYWAGKFVKE